MENFVYQNPVEIIFGKGSISALSERLPKKGRILMLYGGGSIKKNGVYDQCVKALGKHDFVEFGGIEPNPLFETCMEAVKLAKGKKAKFILSVGGGSVLDAAKFIAAAAEFKGNDPWEILSKGAALESALPIGAVLTLPATGSEMNPHSVISRRSSDEKLHFSNPLVYPKFSILDPETTYSLPTRQTVNGIVDAFVHVMEQYMTYENSSPLQDRFCESIALTLVELSPKLLSNPSDYNQRANLMWAATCALNGFCSCGKIQDWGTHMIGHELTAFYGIDHAVSLAIVLPRLWLECFDSKKEKLAQFARRVFSSNEADNDKAAVEAVVRTEAFFNSIGMRTRLADYGIGASEAADRIRSRFASRGGVSLGERGDIDAERAAKIVSKS